MVAIDGKTVRRSHQRSKGKAAIHRVPVFAARPGLVLGHVKVAEKANEIVAIPRRLDMLSIAGAIVIIDTMGCQRDIVHKIFEKNTNYFLTIKSNQGTRR